MTDSKFVPYETARKLKEAGYDIWGDYVYQLGNDYYPTPGYIFSFDYRTREDTFWPAPTLADAQRWFREKKKIDVYTIPEGNEYKTIIHHKRDDKNDIELDQTYGTYEEALKAGIEKVLENRKKPFVVERIVKTCSACPSQWDIFLDDGRYVYVRYRWGGLRLTLAENEDALFNGYDQVIYDEQIGDGFDGVMEEEELRDLTKDILDWSNI